MLVSVSCGGFENWMGERDQEGGEVKDVRERTVWKWAFLDWEGGRGALGKCGGE